MKEYESIQTLLDPVRNFGKVTVSTGYTNLDTVIVLSAGDGTRLPYPITDGPFNLIWYNWSEYRDPADDPNREIVRVTARTGDIITVTRPEEGTIATNKNLIGRTYKMILSVTAKTISDLAKTAFTFQNVTGKVTNTVYQNTNSTARFVAVSFRGAVGGQNTIIAYTNSSNPPTEQVARTDNPMGGTAGWYDTIVFIVLPNNYYQVTKDGFSVQQTWIEWN